MSRPTPSAQSQIKPNAQDSAASLNLTGQGTVVPKSQAEPVPAPPKVRLKVKRVGPLETSDADEQLQSTLEDHSSGLNDLAEAAAAPYVGIPHSVLLAQAAPVSATAVTAPDATVPGVDPVTGTGATAAASWNWILPAALLGLAASGSSSSSTATVMPASRIRVVDGPIKDAKVYVDLNNDGVLDASDPEVGTTDADGMVTLNLTAAQAGFGLLAKGGTDTATAKAFAGVLAAPKGSTVINPLTTLVAAVMEGGKTLAQAQDAVKAALGITGVSDLTTYDTFAEASKAGATAAVLAIHQKAVQVANIIVSGSAAVVGNATAPVSDSLAAASRVVDKLAMEFSSATAAVPVTDAMLARVLTAAGATANAAEAAKSIVAVNSVVAEAATLNAVAQAQVLAQDVLVTAFKTGNTAMVAALQDSNAAKNLAASVDTTGQDTTAPSTPTLTLGAGVAGGATTSEATQSGGVLTVTAESGSMAMLTFSRGGVSVKKSVAGNGATPVAVVLSANDLTTLGNGSISVSATATDAAGNASSAATTSFTLDTVAPTVAITSSAAALKIGQTATLTFTFSEDPGTSFAWDGSTGDLAVSNGTLSAIAGTGLTRTATFTPAASLASGSASITVTNASYTDAAGNTGSAGTTPSISIDTAAPAAPTLSLGTGVANGATSAEATATAGVLTVTAEAGASTVVTLSRSGGGTFSKTVTGNGATPVAVVLSANDLTTLGNGSISVSAVATDAAGNASSAATTSFTLDTVAPTVAITSSAAALKIGQTATLTFTFSEDPGTSFAWDGSTGDLAVSNGTLSAIAGTGLTRTATFTPAASLASGSASITVTNASYADAAGNTGSAGTTPSISIDTAAPAAPTLSLGTGVADGATSAEATAQGGALTVTAEAGASTVVNLSRSGGGTVSKTVTGNGTTPVAVVLSASELTTLGNGSISVSATATDAAGNASSAATTSFTLDTAAPAAPTLSLGTGVADGATSAEATAQGGALTVTAEAGASTVVTLSRSGGGTVSKTVAGNGATPVAVVLSANDLTTLGNGSISVSAVATDAAGNASSAATTSFTLDTAAPAAPTLSLGTGVSGGATSAEATAQGGALTVAAEAGASTVVTLSRNGGGTVSKTVTGNGTTPVAVVLNAGDLNTLGNGSISVSATTTDAAGNAQTAAAATTSFNLDTVAPAIGQSGMAVVRAARTVTLNFTEEISALDLTTSNFSVTTMTGGSLQANTVLSATVSGSQVQLLLTSDFQAGMVNVEYKIPTASQVGVQDAAGNQAVGFSSGKLADGYIRGADIFIQVSAPYTLTQDMLVPVGTNMPNGTVLQSAQLTPAGTTLVTGSFFYTGIKSNAAGDFFLPSSFPKGAMVAAGGVNVDTGVPNNVVLKAPEGANIINPLTTMVQAVMAKQPAGAALTSDAAALTVASALGLPADLNLTSYDPIAAGSSGGNDATALAVQKAAAQLATLVSLASGSGAVIDNLASAFSESAQSGIKVSLSDSTTLNNALAGVTVSADKQASMADAMSSIAASSSLTAVTSAQSQALDKVAPTAPTVNLPALTNSSTPTVKVNLNVTSTDGSAAVVGDTLIVLVNGAQASSVSLSAADVARGFAQVNLPTLQAGDYQVSARQIDAAGNASNAGASGNVRVDLTAPAASMPAATVNGSAAAQVQSSEAGSAYLVSEALAVKNGVPATGLAVADILALAADQRAQVTLTAANSPTALAVSGLADGAYRLVTVDAAGNVSVASSTALTVDNQVPFGFAIIDAVVDNVEPTVGTVSRGASTNDNTLELSGFLLDPLATGDFVQVKSGTQVLGLATTTADSPIWRFTTPALPNAEHTFTARVVDAAGNQGPALDAYTVTVNANVPTGTALISSATPALTNATSPTLAGSAVGAIAGDVVVLFDGQVRLGQTTINANGSWSFAGPLTQGAHAITAALQGSGGNQGARSAAYSVTIDSTAPTLSIFTDDNSLKLGDVANLSFVFSEPPLAGAPAVRATGATLGPLTLVPQSDGRIYTATLTPFANVSAGSVSLSVPAWSDAAGNVGVNQASPVIAVDTQSPNAPTLTANFGNSTEGFAINLAEKNAGAIIEVSAAQTDLVKLTIGSSTQLLGSGNASYAAGKWSYALTANDYAFIGKSPVPVSASATDAAGNTSALASISISADTVAPLLTPVAVAGVSAQSNRIKANTPSVSFSAEVGATLAVDWNGSGIFQAVSAGTGVNSSGVVQGIGNATSASVTLNSPSQVGTDGLSNTVAVRATDVAGNVTVRTASYMLDTSPVSGRPLVVSQDGRQITLSLSEPVAVADLTLSALSLNNNNSLGTPANGAAVAAVGAAGGRASNFVVTLGTDATMAFGDTLSVNKSMLADAAGNMPAVNLDLEVPQFDATPPVLQIGTDKLTLKQGDTALLSFTFSEAVNGFDRSDISVTPAGALGTLSFPKFNADGTVTYTIAYRPMPGTDAAVKVAVDAARFTDLVGNASSQASSLTLNVDTIAPTVQISASSAGLKAGAQATLTFTFSEVPAAVPTVTPVLGTASGQASDPGVLGTLTPNAQNPKVYTATYTPPLNQAGGKVGFLVGSFTDAAGNAGLTGVAPLIEIDSLAPTLNLATLAKVIKADTASPSALPVLELNFSEIPAALPTITPSIAGVTLTPVPVPAGTTAPATKASYFINVPAGAEGTLSFSLGAWSDRLGNAGTAGILPSLTIDTKAPEVVAAITEVKSGNTAVLAGVASSAQTFTLAGTFTGTLGADKLLVLDAGAVLGEATVTGQAWSLALSKPLANGPHSLSAQAQDTVGNRGAASPAFAFTVNAAVPQATVSIVTAADNQGAIQGSLAHNAFTDDSTPKLSGLLQGSLGTGKVAVYKDGVKLDGFATVTGGSWVYDVTGATGTSTYTAAVLSEAGINGAASAPFTLRTDTTPATLTLSLSKSSLKTGDASVLSLTFSEAVSGFTKNDITGVTAESLGSLTGPVANADGTVTYTVEYRPAAGLEASPVVAVAQGSYTDLVGNAGAAASRSLVVDTLAPNAPLFNPIAGDGVINLAEIKSSAGVTASGTATGASKLSLFVGTLVRDLTVTNGTWSYKLNPDDLAQLGQRSGVVVTARAFDAAGNASAQLGSSTVAVDTSAPLLNINGPLAGDGFLNDAEDEQNLLISGSTIDIANGSTVGVSVGSLSGLSTTVNNNAWSVSLAPAQLKSLTPGAVQVTVTSTATDSAGNLAEAVSRSLVYDPVAPQAPTVTQVNSVSGSKLTNNKSPTLTVTAEPGAKILVTQNGVALAATAYSAQETSAGAYTVTILSPLTDGSYSVRAVDAAGNASAASGTSTDTVRIDTRAPQAVDVSLSSNNPATGVALVGNTLTLRFGTSEALGSAAPVVSIMGKPVTGSALVLVDGKWQATTTVAASDVQAAPKPVEFSIVATDAAGNTMGAPFTQALLPPDLPTLVAYAAAPQISASARIDFVKDNTSQVLITGDKISVDVHFAANVAVTGSPVLNLELTDGAGNKNTVAAAYTTSGSLANYLKFSYTVTAADAGKQYHIGGLSLPTGATINEVGSGALPADLSLPGNIAVTAGNYIYGSYLTGTQGTPGNDAFKAAPGADTSLYDGGAGTRDVLTVQVALPGVTNATDAKTYSLALNTAATAVNIVNAAGSVVVADAAPLRFPAGIENLLFKLVYNTSSTSTPSYANAGASVVFGATTAQYQDGSDYAVQGSFGSDAINVSTDTRLEARYFLRGNTGNDSLTGHAGVDLIDGNSGNDSINAGAGNDTIFWSNGVDMVDGGEGQDTLVLNLSGEDSRVIGRLSGPALAGVTANGVVASYRFNVDDAGRLLVSSFNDASANTTTATGIERVQLRLQDAPIRVTGAILTGSTAADALTANGASPSLLAGLGGNDLLAASSLGNDVLLGGGGDDTLVGSALTDFLYGGEGNDSVTAGAGDDFVVGGAGNDRIDGGDGTADVVGFVVAGTGAGLSTGADLVLAYDAALGGVAVKQGTRALVKISKDAAGALVVSDLGSGTGYTSFGTDAVRNAEKFLFDYPSNASGMGLTVDVAQIEGLLAANATGPGVGTVSSVTKIDWTADKSASTLLAAGNTLRLQAHFTNPVVVEGSPTAFLTIVDDNNASRVVQASHVSSGSGASTTLDFAYTLGAADKGRFHLGAIALNGGTVKEMLPGATAAGLPADLSLNSSNLVNTAGTYLYGTSVVAGTAGNDLLAPFVADPSTVPTGTAGVYASTLPSGGEGNRDAMALPVLLPGVTTAAVASTYTLRFKPAVMNGDVMTTRPMVEAYAPNAQDPAVTVPVQFLNGVEQLLFRVAYKNTDNAYKYDATAEYLVLASGVATHQNPVQSNDRYVQGSLQNDTIDISGDTLTSTRYVVRGSVGNDVIKGHAGTDEIYGDAGNDNIQAGAGNDSIFFGSGADTLDGGDGADTLVLTVPGQSVQAVGRISGPAVAGVTAGSSASSVASVTNAYRMSVSDDGNITVREFSNSSNILTARSVEQLEFRLTQSNERDYVALVAGSATADTLKSTSPYPTVLMGLAGDDALSASNAGSSGDVLMGGGGNDTLTGASGADLMYGGAGNDNLRGNAGDDFMVGGEGNDTLDGGDGAETAGDTAGFMLFGVANGGNLTAEYSSAAAAVLIKQGSTEVAKVTKGANGALIVTDSVAGTPSYLNGGVDTVSKVERFSFDYAANTSGSSLNLTLDQLNGLFLAADRTSPTVTSFSPASGSTGVDLGSNIVLTFSEPVLARAGGTIELMTDYGYGHQRVELIAVGDNSKVQVSGNVVTINPSSDFLANTGYHLAFNAAFADPAGNAFDYQHGAYKFVSRAVTVAAPGTATPLGQLGAYSLSLPKTSAASRVMNADIAPESSARSIEEDGTRLFIDSQGYWLVGQAPTVVNGKTVRDYKPVTFANESGASTRVNDDTFEATAVTAKTIKNAAGTVTGYEIVVKSNEDASTLFAIFTSASGAIVDTDALDDAEILAAEADFGMDLNDSGAVGNEDSFLAEGANQAPDLYIDANGDLVLKRADGSVVALKVQSEDGPKPLANARFDGYEFTGVVLGERGGFSVFVLLPDGSLARFDADPSGLLASEQPALVEAAQPVDPNPATPTPSPYEGPQDSNKFADEAAKESSAGLDLNRDSDTPVTAGWTSSLKTASIATAVNLATGASSPSGAKLTHSEAVGIVKAAIDAATAGGTGKVGSAIVEDLRALASRGDNLFTSTDLTGKESGYLSYVFDKLANTSKANNFFTGGLTTAKALGNLSADSPVADLALLRDKWMLGLDMPNPTTEGDTANPAATAATGTYASFSGVLNDSLGFNYQDVRQGSMGDCYLLAAAAGIAQVETFAKTSQLPAVARYTTAFEQAFTANPNTDLSPTWGVRFYDIQGQAHWTTVNNQFVVKGGAESVPAYAKTPVGKEGEQELWVALLEKAYAQSNALGIFGRDRSENTFFTIEGGMGDPVASLMGGTLTRYAADSGSTRVTEVSFTTPEKSEPEQLALYKSAINEGKFLWVASFYSATNDGGPDWYKGHAYMAFDANPTDPNNDTVNIYNPWGPAAAGENNFVSPFELKLADLIKDKPDIQFWDSVASAPATGANSPALGQIAAFKASRPATGEAAGETNTPNYSEAFSRSIAADGTRLYIGSDGYWQVGQPTTNTDGSPNRDYKQVAFTDGGRSFKVNDDTFEASALAARAVKDAQGRVTGYEIILEANDDPSTNFRLYLDVNGQVVGSDQLDDGEILVAETLYGADFNESGAVGDVQMFVAEGVNGAPDLFTDRNGDLILKAQGGVISLNTLMDGPLSNGHFEEGEFTAVLQQKSGTTVTGYVLVFKLDDGTMSQLLVDATGLLASENPQGLAAGDFDVATAQSYGAAVPSVSTAPTLASLVQAAGGFDITRNNATPLSAGWDTNLSTAGIKTAIQNATTATSDGGTRLTHTEALGIVNAAVAAAQANTNAKVGEAIVGDLRAIAARGDALFTSKDLLGEETGYLGYVFDKIANTSKANNFFTGGTVTAEKLGSLSGESTAAELGKLRDKWLLGLDLPNPRTEGDSANPKAIAVAGTYQTFSGVLTDALGFNYTDINQGSIGNCYLLADLAAIAKQADNAKLDPSNAAIANYQTAFEKVFVTNPAANTASPTWGIRMFDFFDNAHWVTVNNQFVVKEQGSAQPAYAKLKGGTELWVALLEKAYAQANELEILGRTKSENTFMSTEGGNAEPMTTFMSGVSTLLTDKTEPPFKTSSVSQYTTSVSFEDQLKFYKTAMNRGEALYVGSDFASKNADGKTEWVAGHAFMAYDADKANPDNETVMVYNPWGPSEETLAPFQTTLSAFLKAGAKVDFYATDSIAPKLQAFGQNSDGSISFRFSEPVRSNLELSTKLGDSNAMMVATTASADPRTLLLATAPDAWSNQDYAIVTGLTGKTGVRDVMGYPLSYTTPSNFGGHVVGSSGNSNIDLSAVSDKYFAISGGTGNDTLKGGSGPDMLYGGAGNDVLTGGAGDDLLEGGEGNDTLVGGDGAETAGDTAGFMLGGVAGGGNLTAQYSSAAAAVLIKQGSTEVAKVTKGANGALTVSDSVASTGSYLNGGVDTVSMVENFSFDYAANTSGRSLKLTLGQLTALFPVADTTPPTVVITGNAAGSGNGAVTFTYTFSEAVTGFDANKITATGGTKGVFTAVSTTVYTVLVTPVANSTANMELSTITTGVTDAAGNVATAPANYSQVVDTVAPTVTGTVISATGAIGTLLNAGDVVTVTTTYSKAVTGQPTTAPTLTIGTEAGVALAAVVTTGNTRSWTYTITTTGTTDTGSISVVGNMVTGVSDAASNAAAGTSPAATGSFAADTTAPTVAVTSNAAGTTNGAVTITYTFSEAVTGFDTSKITATGGSKGAFTATSATVYTLVVTPAANSTTPMVLATNTVGVTDAAGNAATAPAKYSQVVDTVAPLAPVFASFSDNSGLTTDKITNDKTLTANMTAEAGSKVEIFAGATSLGLATESTTTPGSFSFTTANLSDGSYAFKAVSKDAAGNATASAIETWLIDSVAPAAASITKWESAGNKVNLVMAAEAGSEVSVFKGEVLLGNATETSARGVYSFAANAESSGNYAITTSVKDVAGNVSASKTQTAVFVSGDSFTAVNPGTVDLRVVSSTSTELTMAFFPQFTFTGIDNYSFSVLVDTSKVSMPLDADVSSIQNWTIIPSVEDRPGTSVDLLTLAAFSNTPSTNATTALGTFVLKWKLLPETLGFNVFSFAPNLGDITYSNGVIQENASVKPSFTFTPGNGVATGTSASDLIITGTGNVSVTGGAGADTVLLTDKTVKLTLTDFAFGTDKIDLSKLMSNERYTATGSTAAENIAVMMATTPTNIAALIAAKDASLDNKFGAWFEPTSTGYNGPSKDGILHLFGDTNPTVGSGSVLPSQIDIIIGVNSTGSFSSADFVYLPQQVI